MISRLKGIEGYWYLGSPYSKYPPGIEAAFKHVCQITGELIRLGVPVYSPIAHSHSVAIASGIDPFDHSIWLPADEPMMRGAHGLIIAMMETWRESYGLTEEVRVFAEMERPVEYLDPATLRLSIPADA